MLTATEQEEWEQHLYDVERKLSNMTPLQVNKTFTTTPVLYLRTSTQRVQIFELLIKYGWTEWKFIPIMGDEPAWRIWKSGKIYMKDVQARLRKFHALEFMLQIRRLIDVDVKKQLIESTTLPLDLIDSIIALL